MECYYAEKFHHIKITNNVLYNSILTTLGNIKIIHSNVVL